MELAQKHRARVWGGEHKTCSTAAGAVRREQDAPAAGRMWRRSAQGRYCIRQKDVASYPWRERLEGGRHRGGIVAAAMWGGGGGGSASPPRRIAENDDLWG